MPNSIFPHVFQMSHFSFNPSVDHIDQRRDIWSLNFTINACLCIRIETTVSVGISYHFNMVSVGIYFYSKM